MERDDNNLLLAISGTVIISCLCSLFNALTIDDILNAMSTSQSMALIIVDGGANYVSDDGKLGEQLTQATQTLRSSYSISITLAVGTAMIGTALIWRTIQQARSSTGSSRALKKAKISRPKTR